jgi:hypothetical protein
MSRKGRMEALLTRLVKTPQAVTFTEIREVCEHFFTFDRQDGSHRIYKTGLVEPAIVNIQPRGKMAKPYQCRQVAGAVKAKHKGGQ